MKKITFILFLFITSIYNTNAQDIGNVQYKTHDTSPTTDCYGGMGFTSLTYGVNDDETENKNTATVEIDNSLTPNDSSKHIVFRVASNAVYAEVLNDDGETHNIEEFLVQDSIDDGLEITKLAKGKSGNKVFTFGDICTSTAGNKVVYFIIDIENGFSTTGTKAAKLTLKMKTGELKLNININTTAATASITNANNEVISFSPNPAKEVLNVNSAKTIDSVRLLDMTGKVVSNKNVNSKAATLDTSNLVSGIYILKTSIEGKVITKKIVKN